MFVYGQFTVLFMNFSGVRIERICALQYWQTDGFAVLAGRACYKLTIALVGTFLLRFLHLPEHCQETSNASFNT